MNIFLCSKSKQKENMEYKIFEDYFEIIKPYIKNQKVFNEIEKNINFVEKYIDQVEQDYEKEEQEIVYKNLGIMSFSCIEALLKSFIKHFQMNCQIRKCEKCNDCNYYKSDKQIKEMSILQCFEHLNNMRVISVLPFEEDAIEELKDIRNYIHISKYLEETNDNHLFDKEFVEKLLQIFYVFINQIAVFPFSKELDLCISQVDCDGYEETGLMNKKDKLNHNTQRIYCSLNNLLDNKPQKTDCKFLKLLNDNCNYNIKELSRLIGMSLYYSQRRYENDEKFEFAKSDFLAKIQRYCNNKTLSEKIIAEFNKIKIMMK